jgi:hypothetical protein
MNEVNMKYWFSDFKKKIFYRFSGRIRNFYRRKTDFYEKKNPSLCRLPSTVISYESFVRPIFERCFQVRNFSFRITEGICLTGVSFHFWSQKQIPSGSCHRNFWLLFHFHVKNLHFFLFVGWFDVKFYAELKKVYFMGSEIQPGVMRAQKRNLLVWIHRSEILCWAQKSILYGVWNATTNHESPIICKNFNFWN